MSKGKSNFFYIWVILFSFVTYDKTTDGYMQFSLWFCFEERIAFVI